jgi:hypothetical protein
VNLFAEPMPEHQGEPMPVAHYPTPGTRLLGVLPKGPVRGIRQSVTGGVYAVGGDTVYSVDPVSRAATALGTITGGLRTPVSMADNGLDMVIVDGSGNGWHVTLAGNAFAQIDNTAGTFYGADKVDYLDTYLLFNKPTTPQFYSSDSLALTFDPLWFANKESYSDLLVTLAVAKREIWLFGSQTTEIWFNSGKPDFPFESMPGIFIDHGCVAKYSVANYDNSVFWLTADRQGRGIVIMGAKYETKRISTYAIEAEIAKYERINDAIGFCYQLSGHTFYVLTFPRADKTWVHDITTGLWHEWLWIDSNGDEHRHRANCYWPINGVGVVGDWQNGNLYALDQDVYTDNGTPIKRVRSYPHILNDGKRVFYRQLMADIECGEPRGPQWVGLPADDLLRDAGGAFMREDGAKLKREAGLRVDHDMVSLRWSDDRGHTFGNPVVQTAGNAGEYLTSLQYQRLGMARDRVFELSWSTASKRALQGAWIDVTPGMS